MVFYAPDHGKGQLHGATAVLVVTVATVRSKAVFYIFNCLTDLPTTIALIQKDGGSAHDLLCRWALAVQEHKYNITIK